MRKFAFTALTLLLLVAFAIGVPSVVRADEKIVINFAAQGDSTPATQAVLDAFNESQDEYEAVWIDMTNDSGAMRTQLINSLAAGSDEYDVVSMDVVWAGEFAAAGYIEALDGYMRDNKLSVRNYNQGSISAGKYDGKQFALPFFPDLGILYVRKDIVSEEELEMLESGEYTWEDLKDLAAKYKGEEETVDGFVYQSKQYEGLVCNFNEFSDNWRDIQAGLEGMMMMQEEAAPENILIYTEGETANSFIKGDSVFARNWPYQWGAIASEGEIDQDQVAIAPLPMGGTVGGWLLGMNKNSSNPEGAFALINFITGPEGQKIMSMEGGYLPGFNEVLEDEEVIENNLLLSMPGFVKALESTISRPVAEDYAAVSDELQQAIHKYLAGDMEIEDAVEAIEEALAKAEPFEYPEDEEVEETDEDVEDVEDEDVEDVEDEDETEETTED
ncbi:MAG TPA: extracellular solute-binding protein [Fastidiosipila sp.]|nr:extracellular solute-binding protein [Fastidiosipila sp.]